MLSEEYRKADPEELKRVQREANDFNSEHGYTMTTNNMSVEQKLWVSDEVIEVLRKNILQLNDLTGLECVVLFGTCEFRHERKKMRLLGTSKLPFLYKKILVSKKRLLTIEVDLCLFLL